MTIFNLSDMSEQIFKVTHEKIGDTAPLSSHPLSFSMSLAEDLVSSFHLLPRLRQYMGASHNTFLEQKHKLNVFY